MVGSLAVPLTEPPTKPPPPTEPLTEPQPPAVPDDPHPARGTAHLPAGRQPPTAESPLRHWAQPALRADRQPPVAQSPANRPPPCRLATRGVEARRACHHATRQVPAAKVHDETAAADVPAFACRRDALRPPPRTPAETPEETPVLFKRPADLLACQIPRAW